MKLSVLLGLRQMLCDLKREKKNAEHEVGEEVALPKSTLRGIIGHFTLLAQLCQDKPDICASVMKTLLHTIGQLEVGALKSEPVEAFLCLDSFLKSTLCLPSEKRDHLDVASISGALAAIAVARMKPGTCLCSTLL